MHGDFISLINRDAKRRHSIDFALDRILAEARRFDEIRERLDSRGRSPRKLSPVITWATEDGRLVDPDFARARAPACSRPITSAGSRKASEQLKRRNVICFYFDGYHFTGS
jgi:SOS response regulatory protein OraA/RecX